MNLSLIIGVAASLILGAFGYSLTTHQYGEVLPWCVYTIVFSYTFFFGLHKNETGFKGVPILFGRRIPISLFEGWVWLPPRPFMFMTSVDCREKTANPPPIKGNARNMRSNDATVPVQADASAQWQVFDPYLFLGVDDVPRALDLSLDRELRTEMAEHQAVSLPGVKDEISDDVQSSLNTYVNRWGIRVIQVRVQAIIIPQRLAEAATNIDVEDLQAQAEAIEIDHIRARVRELVADGINANEALKVIQTERGKATRVVIDGSGNIVGAVVGGQQGQGGNP